MSERARIAAKKLEVKKDNSVFPKQKSSVSKSKNSPIDRLLFLQRTIGNQAVQRMFKSGVIQAKLKIGQPGDIYEREADSVADRVMRMPQSVCPECEEEKEKIQTRPIINQITPLVQRQVEPEEEEEEETIQTKSTSEPMTCMIQKQAGLEEEEEPIQTKLSFDEQSAFQRHKEEGPDEEEKPVQRRAKPVQTPVVTTSLEKSINSLKGGGQPIPKTVCNYFEQRFGYDFSQVRVHTNAQAVDSARAANARAFTRGHDIVFNVGQFSPGSTSGRALLAHELTHVVQQKQGIKRKVTDSTEVLQCWRWGAGNVPGEPNFRPVARSHRPRVRAAMRLLGRIVRGQRCRNYFRDHCPGGTAATLRNLYRRMRIWGLHEAGSLGGNSGDHVAYEEPYIYRVGRFSIAATLLHEMMHMCGIGVTAADERTCERAVERCRAYTPFIESVSPRSGRTGTIVRITGYGFGLSQGSADLVEFNGVNAGRALRWRYTHGIGSEIRIRVPAGARTGSIVVINNRVRSNRRRFRILL